MYSYHYFKLRIINTIAAMIANIKRQERIIAGVNARLNLYPSFRIYKITIIMNVYSIF